MADIKDRIVAMAPGIQLMSVASVAEDGAPWVRYVAGRISPDLKLRFSTHLSSRKIGQLQKDNRLHATLGANDFTAQHWLQFEGTAEISTSKEEREAFWFDGLRAYVSGIDDPEYAVVIVSPKRIEIASMVNEPEIWQAASAKGRA